MPLNSSAQTNWRTSGEKGESKEGVGRGDQYNRVLQMYKGSNFDIEFYIFVLLH